MTQDNSLQIAEAVLIAKHYSDRDKVIFVAEALYNIVRMLGVRNIRSEDSFKLALEKLESLSFEEMLELICIIKTRALMAEEDEEDGAPPDELTGEQLYREAMQNYREGKFELAAGLFRSAAEKKHARARYDYGLCLFSGIGVNEDKVAAIKLFVAASAIGIPEGDRMLRFIANENDQITCLLGK